MLPSIHGEDMRLPGVLAAVDEGEIGDGGLDETFESGRKSCRDQNPENRVRAGVEEGFAGASVRPMRGWHLALDHQPRQLRLRDNERV